MPTNPVPITCFSPNIGIGGTVYCTFFDWDGNSFATVPNDKKVIVTGIYPTSNSLTDTNNWYALSIAAYSGTASISYSRLRVYNYDNEQSYLAADAAPLIVLNEGQRLGIYSYLTTQTIMNVAVRGFLVNDLSYE